jgi:N utilization substance protein A
LAFLFTAVGDRVRAVIKAVNKNAKGPQIVLSRTDPALLIKLFEQEVPEIYDGTVVIRGAVREAGDRAKVAVFSRERDVDPVGACVGMKGTRVQSIIRELRGEKIDIVDFSEDAVTFVTNAISPAKVQRVSIIDDAERVMEVVVEDKQLSLAIGKKGQNVRLAAKLTGWKIDIKSEEEKRREVEAQFAGFEAAASDEVTVVVEGVDQAALDSVSEAGFDTLERLAGASVEDVTSATGMDAQTAERVIAAARHVPTESTGAGEPGPADEAPAAGADAAAGEAATPDAEPAPSAAVTDGEK